MKRYALHLALAVLVVTLIACATAVKKPPVPPKKPPYPTVTVFIMTEPAAWVLLEGAGDEWKISNVQGNIEYVVPLSLVKSHLYIEKPGYEKLSRHIDIDGKDQTILAKLHKVGSKIRIVNRSFENDDGPFIWRGVTAFRLLEQVASGRVAEAEAFMDWAQGAGFNVLRVLAMAQGMFELSAANGQAAIPALLAAAEERGMYVELVLLADTALQPVDLQQQVRAAGKLCDESWNCIAQIANEHYHATQDTRLHYVPFLSELARELPTSLLYTLSPAADDEALEPRGQYITRHLDRGRDPFNMIRRVRELENVSRETGLPVVNDEPIGANESDSPGRRLSDPDIFYTMGVLGRIFTVGSTFHCEDCLHSRVPGPVQQSCAAAFIEGTRVVPDTVRLTFKNATWTDSPVAGADWDRVVRVYSGINGQEGITIALGITGDPAIRWQLGWGPIANLGRSPRVQIWSIRGE